MRLVALRKGCVACIVGAWSVSSGATLPLTAQADSRPCAADSGRANQILWSLEHLVHEREDSGVTVTLSHDPRLCLAGNRVAQGGWPDSLKTTTPVVYVYTVDSPRPRSAVRYIIVWAEENPRSEWEGSCWYDRRWQQVGHCLMF
jgi:hypothetical protein